MNGVGDNQRRIQFSREENGEIVGRSVDQNTGEDVNLVALRRIGLAVETLEEGVGEQQGGHNTLKKVHRIKEELLNNFNPLLSKALEAQGKGLQRLCEEHVQFYQTAVRFYTRLRFLEKSVTGLEGEEDLRFLLAERLMERIKAERVCFKVLSVVKTALGLLAVGSCLYSFLMRDRSS